jgi:hypothetical protein
MTIADDISNVGTKLEGFFSVIPAELSADFSNALQDLKGIGDKAIATDAPMIAAQVNVPTLGPVAAQMAVDAWDGIIAKLQDELTKAQAARIAAADTAAAAAKS